MNETDRSEVRLTTVVLGIMLCLGLIVAPPLGVIAIGGLLLWRIFWLAGQKGEAK